ncbi:MAG TPA: hypothetical protein VIH86_11800 [Puia sp.]|jgi:hypothetical protein
MARGYVAVLCQVAIIFWLSRNILGSEKSWRILLASTIFYTAAATPVELIAILKGLVNSIGWSTVAVQFIVGALCLYFFFRKNETRKIHAIG